MKCRTMALILLLTAFLPACGQHPFSIKTESDSLSWLILRGDKGESRWRLAFPVYRMEQGDVDGDGQTEALVGVIKPTRYYPTPARRLFIFKQVRGRIRAMWMGSRLGGTLLDFRFVDGRVRSLETSSDGRYAVLEYAWDDFGLSFVRFLTQSTDEASVKNIFNTNEYEETDTAGMRPDGPADCLRTGGNDRAEDASHPSRPRKD